VTPGLTPPGTGESKVPGVEAAGVVNSAGPGRWVRFLDALAGLLSAGVLVVGIILLLASLIAPSAVAAAGLGVADGPGWDRVIAHLVVGAAGELVVLLRRRWPTFFGAMADVVVIVAALPVIWWAWIP
jgi:hypothetical protein